MSDVKRPESVRIAGRVFRIHFVELPGGLSDKEGLVKYNEQEIFLDIQQNRVSITDTLLHECIHVIDHFWQLELVEKQVHLLANALMQVFLDNPGVRQYILDNCKQEPENGAKPVRTTKTR